MNVQKVHDYTRPRWGHSFTINRELGDMSYAVCGWGYGIKDGHHIRVATEAGAALYRVEDCSYYSDPRDMWKATIVLDVEATEVERGER